MYNAARQHQCDFWLANDWTTLPIARLLAAEQRVPYGYDTHELASEEYAQRLRFRLVNRPVIRAIERRGIRGATVVSCVSTGIADHMQGAYSMKSHPLVIRNMPVFEEHIFRPTGSKISVLYHGIVAPGRGLEICIESIARWRDEFELVIRGPSQPDYAAYLAELAVQHGVSSRIQFDLPVPTSQLINEATGHDVGLFVLPSHSLQNTHVLPNKFFEYVMAGLALCISDLPEMSALIRQHGLGLTIPDFTADAVADQINRLTPMKVDEYKRASLEAAKQLHWENDIQLLLNAVAGAVDGSETASAHLPNG